MKCELCSGHGVIDCPECGGSGQYNSHGEIVDCQNCGQRGNAPGQLCCYRCDGTGEVEDRD